MTARIPEPWHSRPEFSLLQVNIDQTKASFVRFLPYFHSPDGASPMLKPQTS